MTVIARARAFELFKAGFNTSTKIRKQLLTEGEDIPRPTIENWRRRDKWDATGGVEAIKAVAKGIRKARDIAKRAGRTPADNDVMRGSISNALNELGAVASEGAQALRAIIPSVVDEIKTVAEFNSFVRTMAEITSLAVTATVEIVKVLPDVGPGGDGPGGNAFSEVSEPSEMENLYSNAIREFREKYG